MFMVLALISCRAKTGCYADAAWKQQLFTEVRVGNLPSVEALLSSEHCPDVVDDNGHTPLMIAAANGHYEVAKLLLGYGVKIDAKEKIGYTSLMFASEACEPRLVRLLIDSGAYVPMRNYARETSFDLAKQRADFWKRSSESTAVSGLNIAQRWESEQGGGPPPKASCAEVSDLLEKHTTGG
jgi:ankyrin repeat protein